MLISLAWQHGGFYPPAYLRTGAVSLAIVAGLLIVRPPTYRIAPEAVVAIGCLLGYAGWGPGQLDQELTASAWLSAPAEADLVFNTAPEVMWDRAIRSLGVDPMALQLGPGVQ